MSQPRIIGLDHGLAKIGVAIADPQESFAMPLKTVNVKACKQKPELMAQAVLDSLTDYEIKCFVVGLPLHLDRGHSESTKNAQAFIDALKKLSSAPVESTDERLTSSLANTLAREQGLKRKKRDQKNDETAACLLLQTYLDQKKFS